MFEYYIKESTDFADARTSLSAIIGVWAQPLTILFSSVSLCQAQLEGVC